MVEQQIAFCVANELRYFASNSAVRNPYAKDVGIYHDLILLVADVGSPPRQAPLLTNPTAGVARLHRN